MVRLSIHERWIPRCCALAAIALSIAYGWGSSDFCLDDAWIHLSYAKSLWSGGELSYNPGDLETGFSSPLWVLVLAPLSPLAGVATFVKIVGAMLHGASAWLGSDVALRLAKQRPVSAESPGTSEKRRRLWVGVVAGLAIAFHPVLLQGASSGMEVSLSAACLLLFLWADLAQKQTLCLGMAALLPLVRPEFLACTISYSVIRALQVRSWRPLLIVSCSLAGMATWVAYSYVATGYPLPNTYYVKSGNGVATGLSYLSNTWAVSEPWLVSLGGAALLAFAMFETRRQYRSAFWAMGAMWLSSLLAIAASRPLHNGILFFELRYFAPLAVLPPIALAQGLLCIRRRWLGPLLLVPMVALAVFQLPDSYRLNRMQEGNIRRLHREPAQRIARELPSDSVVAVEGAGAARFFTPRSMRVVDVLGLNNRVIAHGPSDVVKLCAVLLQEPDYFLLPDNFVRSFSELFELESRWVAIEPSYAQGRRIGIFRVHLFASAGPTKLLTRECSALRGETP